MVSMRHQEIFNLQICEARGSSSMNLVHACERFHGKEEENLGKSVAFSFYTHFPMA